MDNDDQAQGDRAAKTVTRRSVLKTGAAAGAAAVAVLAAPKLPGGGSASAAPGNVLVLDVAADPSQLDLIPGAFAGQGPFYIPGDILAPGTSNKIGDFHCWGFFINGGAVGVVSQEYNLTGRGKIQVQGLEDEGPRAVTGGTGEFSNVRGEMTGADLSGFPDFNVTFVLFGSGGPQGAGASSSSSGSSAAPAAAASTSQGGGPGSDLPPQARGRGRD